MVNIYELLKQMTVDEKIGQLTQYISKVFCDSEIFSDSEAPVTGPIIKLRKLGLKKEDLSKVGSCLNFQNVDEMRTIQDCHLAADRNKIPMLFMMDVIHGYRTIYPIPLALGCSFDPALVEDCTKMAAKEASANGVQVTFTPMVDYVRDARWGRVMETCGEEPLLNGMMGAAQVRAFQGDDLKNPDTLATCVKHFAAYGGAEAGRDYNTVELSEHLLREYYLPAYKACIDAGTTMLMPSFNSLNGVPATANTWLMKKILKEEWGFEGVVISDYAAVTELIRHGVAEDRKQAARLAFACGCDIEMCSSAYYHHLQEWIEEGVFTEEQLDEAVLRVLKLKESLGLFEDPYRDASTEKAEASVLTKENRALVRRAATECAVLLKNDGILPLSKEIKKVALIGPFANHHGIIGFWACRGRDEESVTVAEGIRNALPDAEISVIKGCGSHHGDTDESGFDAAVAAAKEADVVILCLGEPQNYSGEGNCRTDLRLPGVQEKLAAAVAAANPNTAAVLFNGRPLVLTELNKTVPAILEMWFPGTEGGNAVADLLLGKVNPAGKLTMSFPKASGQCPIYYNHPSTGRPKSVEMEDEHRAYCSNYIDCGNMPLYPFGFGLSYSDISYEDLTLDKEQITAADALRVTVTVKNNSDRPAVETVQLYMRDLVASNVRPIQQLIAFEKVKLAAGETKEVLFTVDEPMLRFWNNEHKHVSEAGKFTLSTGCADRLLHTKEFELI